MKSPMKFKGPVDLYEFHASNAAKPAKVELTTDGDKSTLSIDFSNADQPEPAHMEYIRRRNKQVQEQALERWQ